MHRLAERTLLAILTLSAAGAGGCASMRHVDATSLYYGNPIKRGIPVAAPAIPRELSKTALPEYIIEAPDILLIEAIVPPAPPMPIMPHDLVYVRVDGLSVEDLRIDGLFNVDPEGMVHFPGNNWSVHIGGLMPHDARAAIQQYISEARTNAVVTFDVAQTAASRQAEAAVTQQIAGEHIVGPDGMVSLGTYGKVFVTGMTQLQARTAIEAHLSQYLQKLEVSVDVFAYNSKHYYVVTQGAGLGDGLSRFPVTGNETVLDAIADINGLESVSSKRIWVARPSPLGGPDQVLPVDWRAITERGRTETNYQVMPGDRIFIAEDRLVAMDTFVSKVLSPFERMMGFVALGTNTVSELRFFSRGPTGFSSF